MDYREVETIAMKLLAIGRAAVAEYEAGMLENETLLELCRDLVGATAGQLTTDAPVQLVEDESMDPFLVVDVEPASDVMSLSDEEVEATLVVSDVELGDDPLLVISDTTLDDAKSPLSLPEIEPVDVPPMDIPDIEPVVKPVEVEPPPLVPDVEPDSDSVPMWLSREDDSADPTPTDDSDTPVCAQCNTELRIGARFCTTCGLKVGESAATPPPIMPAPPIQRCNTCHAELQADALFCTTCGASVTQPPVMPSEIAAMPPPLFPDAPPSSDKFCDICGLGVAADVTTCPSCQGNEFS